MGGIGDNMRIGDAPRNDVGDADRDDATGLKVLAELVRLGAEIICEAFGKRGDALRGDMRIGDADWDTGADMARMIGVGGACSAEVLLAELVRLGGAKKICEAVGGNTVLLFLEED